VPGARIRTLTQRHEDYLAQTQPDKRSTSTAVLLRQFQAVSVLNRLKLTHPDNRGVQIVAKPPYTQSDRAIWQNCRTDHRRKQASVT